MHAIAAGTHAATWTGRFGRGRFDSNRNLFLIFSLQPLTSYRHGMDALHTQRTLNEKFVKDNGISSQPFSIFRQYFLSKSKKKPTEFNCYLELGNLLSYCYPSGINDDSTMIFYNESSIMDQLKKNLEKTKEALDECILLRMKQQKQLEQLQMKFSTDLDHLLYLQNQVAVAQKQCQTRALQRALKRLSSRLEIKKLLDEQYRTAVKNFEDSSQFTQKKLEYKQAFAWKEAYTVYCELDDLSKVHKSFDLTQKFCIARLATGLPFKGARQVVEFSAFRYAIRIPSVICAATAKTRTSIGGVQVSEPFCLGRPEAAFASGVSTAITSDGHLLALCQKGGELYIWNINNGFEFVMSCGKFSSDSFVTTFMDTVIVGAPGQSYISKISIGDLLANPYPSAFKTLTVPPCKHGAVEKSATPWDGALTYISERKSGKRGRLVQVDIQQENHFELPSRYNFVDIVPRSGLISFDVNCICYHQPLRPLPGAHGDSKGPLPVSPVTHRWDVKKSLGMGDFQPRQFIASTSAPNDISKGLFLGDNGHVFRESSHKSVAAFEAVDMRSLIRIFRDVFLFYSMRLRQFCVMRVAVA
eukprot:gnl/Chilomastix_cuspidata/1283.p1 GENE.gnl/Chilomastix_cuspidata/1283~~gnl/Chilomastix_cuspidata/1283.p1  ORF type:complete len:585 (-),score=135.96 gnl/Chilomastix_cuspidata/1283:59-1813(-)